GVILEFRTNQLIRKFLDGKDLIRYANTGPVTPDHVIWTKPKPLILPSEFDAITVRRAVEKFTVAYKRYFTKNNQRFGNTKTMREASPRVVLVPGQGLYGAGDTAENARMIADLAENWIEVITAAESIGKFSSISTRDMFDIEYWSPESAKLEVAISPPLKGRVALITGGGSGIGQATAQIFRDAGAEVVVLDANANATRSVAEKLNGLGLVVDVTDAIAVGQAFKRVISSFGGLDIVVSNAGGAWQGEIGTVSESVLRKSFELNFFAHQTIAQNAVRVMRAQHSAGGSGGCILFNTSKQAVNPGKNFGPYGLPKAATLFLVRQYALDHGKHGIRAGGVNADRVRSGLLSDEMIAMRSKARKLSEDEYLRGNLLGREVTANDVAKAFLDLALSPSTTGAILTVDGGNIEAALR
nr:SDR family oxidoreductase [Rhodospirillales bacterium]